MAQTTTNARDIRATPEEVFAAFATPAALEAFQAPGNMSAKVHRFDFRVGSSYEMSLYYPETETKVKGKTGDKEDGFTARFVDIVPNKKIVQAIRFDSTDAAFSEEMMMEVTFEPVQTGTRVSFLFRNIPAGIKPEDNEAGTISTLEKLAEYVEGKSVLADKNGPRST